MEKQKHQDSRTALRLPHEQREKIDKLVAQGKFKNLSQVVRVALTQFFAKGEELPCQDSSTSPA